MFQQKAELLTRHIEVFLELKSNETRFQRDEEDPAGRLPEIEANMQYATSNNLRRLHWWRHPQPTPKMAKLNKASVKTSHILKAIKSLSPPVPSFLTLWSSNGS